MMKKLKNRSSLTAWSIFLCSLFASSSVSAQITPDGTMPTDATESGNVSKILEGADLKIDALRITDSKMHQLPDDELKNIVGGYPSDPHDDKWRTYIANKSTIILASPWPPHP